MSTSFLPPLLLLALPGLPSAAPARAQDDDVVSQEELESLTAEIKADIAKLREKEFPRDVAVSVADEKELIQYAKARMEQEQTPEETAADETMAKMLGLIPPEMDLVQTMFDLLQEQIGGFYDPGTEGFYLMDRFGGDLAKVILSHELTHALDDQLYDIDGHLAKLEGNGDAQLAFHAVVEGSGTAVMNVWSLRKLMAGELDMKALTEAGNLGADELAKAPPYLWKPLIVAYMKGAAFLNRTDDVMVGQMKLPALEDFDTSFTKPPRSTEQILHPEKYWNAEELDEPVTVSIDVGELPEGWTVLREDTLGELGLGLVVEPLEERTGLSPIAAMAAKYTSEASEGWGGDRFVLLGRGEARILRCETAWDSERDAAEFVAAVNELQEHVRESLAETARLRGLEGSGLEVVAGEDGLTAGLLAWMGVDDTALAAVRSALHATSTPKLR